MKDYEIDALTKTLNLHAERKDIGKLEIEPNKSVKKEEENGK